MSGRRPPSGGVSDRRLGDALQRPGPGGYTFEVPALKEQKRLRAVPGTEGAHRPHHDGVVAAVVFLMQLAIHPGEGLVQHRIPQRRGGVVDAGKLLGTGKGKLGGKVLVPGRQDVDGEPPGLPQQGPRAGGAGGAEGDQGRVQGKGSKGRVLTGATPVREPTRDRVLAAIKELRYRLNGAARALVQGQQPIVGVITRDTSAFG